MIMLEISPVQRLRALVCLCMRMAPPLRLVKPSQRGSLHLNKQNMDDDMARTSILEPLRFHSMAVGKEGYTTGFDSMADRRWGLTARILKSSVLYERGGRTKLRNRSFILGLRKEANRGKQLFVHWWESSFTAERVMLSPDGPEGRFCNNARGVSSAFACIFEVPHLETPRRSPSEDDTATELTGREFADLCKACFCNV